MVSKIIALWEILLRLFGFRPEESQQDAPRKQIILLAPPKQQPAKSDKLHPYNDLENWGHDWTHQPPLSKVAIGEWQRRFDQAFGLNRDGKSCFKLVWNGDRRYWDRFAYDWDAYGKGTKWEERPRILWKKVDLGNGDYVDLFPPRWLILVRIEPEQFAETWKAESWVFDATRGPLVPNPRFGIVPGEPRMMRAGQNKQIRDDEVPQVFWDTFEVIGEHDAFCCEVFEGECFGAFRQPTDKDIERLHHLKREFESRDQSPYEKLSEKTEARIARFTREYYRQQYAKMPASTEIVIEHADAYLAPLLSFTGDTLSEREKKRIVKTALDRHYTERAEEYEQQLRGN